METLKGTVVKSTGSWYRVRTNDGNIYDCRVRGKLRLSPGLNATNPVAVGDKVKFDWDAKNRAGSIRELGNRKNFLIRQASNLSREVSIIASNLDFAVLVTTVAFPRTARGFIDRFLVTAEAYDVPTVLVINKTDLYQGKNARKWEELKEIYREIDYPVLSVSAKTGEGMSDLKNKIKDKSSILTGQSGVGKSMILNYLNPDLGLKTGNISGATGKGKHITTFAEMHRVDANTFVVDTPGIKEFGLVGFELWEISHFFPEMRDYIKNCRFNNCLHQNEPGCAVRKAVEAGEVREERFQSYLKILESLQEEEKKLYRRK